jgi:hypothetical protein
VAAKICNYVAFWSVRRCNFVDRYENFGVISAYIQMEAAESSDTMGAIERNILFYTEDEGMRHLRNVCTRSTNYIAPHPGRPQS